MNCSKKCEIDYYDDCDDCDDDDYYYDDEFAPANVLHDASRANGVGTFSFLLARCCLILKELHCKLILVDVVRILNLYTSNIPVYLSFRSFLHFWSFLIEGRPLIEPPDQNFRPFPRWCLMDLISCCSCERIAVRRTRLIYPTCISFSGIYGWAYLLALKSYFCCLKANICEEKSSFFRIHTQSPQFENQECKVKVLGPLHMH